MRSSVLLSAAFAANAMAAPARLDKRVYVTDFEVVTITEMVTEGVELPPEVTPTVTIGEGAPVIVTPVSIPTPTIAPPPPPPPPATTETPIIVAPPPSQTPTSTPAPTTETPTPTSTPTPTTTQPVHVANGPSSTPSSGGIQLQPLCNLPPGTSTDQLTTKPNTEAAKKWLAYHDAHRTNHTTCTMYWDYSLEADAKKAADTCVYAHTKSDGQNMAEYTVYGTELTSDNITAAAGTFSNMYYSEGQFFTGSYGLATPSTSQDTGHFTQMLWAGSHSVGCATTVCGSMLLSFCNYSPGGNILTEYTANVLDLISSPLPPLCAESGGTTGCITDEQLGIS